MTESAVYTAILGVLLSVLGVLLMRLLSSMDENTKAVVDLNLNVKELGVLMGVQKSRLEQLEADAGKHVESMNSAIELVRQRTHDLANDLAALSMKFEIHKIGPESARNRASFHEEG